MVVTRENICTGVVSYDSKLQHLRHELFSVRILTCFPGPLAKESKVKIIGLCLMVGLLAIVGVNPGGMAIADPLTPEQMYLDPASVTPDYYDYDYKPAGYTHSFSDVASLRILPPLVEGGNEYYFTPWVDYTADITGTTGSVTFITPGPYFVLATYTNSTSELFDFGIEFDVFSNGGTAHKTYNWHRIPTPNPNVVAVDPDLVRSEPRHDPGTVVVSPTSWQALTDYLKGLSNAHVELGGHGSPGSFYYRGSRVLYDCTEETNNWLRSMQGHVRKLTFMSCSTGAGEEGRAFLQKVANYLSESGGYTNAVGGNGKDWFINGDGKLVTFVVPEPSAVCLVVCGSPVVGFVIRKRWRHS